MYKRVKLLCNLYSQRLSINNNCLQKSSDWIVKTIVFPVRRSSGVILGKTEPDETSLKRDKYSRRTHNCGELRIDNVGERVELSGWMEYQRMDKFIVLRDGYGSMQLIIPDNRPELIKIMENISYETVITATGRVNPRPDNQVNKKMKTGEIELIVDSLEVLNPAMKQLPLPIRQINKAKESIRMQYRYLDLRFPDMQKNLRLRSKILMKMREFLINECCFVDVETPTLFRRTPGGAQEFVVPTRHPGKFYSLVQSPQQFKQLLMIGGIDRYFQIARCYRDEGARLDRQPEFTQLDIEMSFVDRESIMGLTEDLLAASWFEEFGELRIPFDRIRYEDAIEFYGTDKPDLRLPYKIKNITEIIKKSDQLRTKTGINYDDDKFGVYALVFPGENDNFSKSTKTQFEDIAKREFLATKLLQVKVFQKSWKTGIASLLSENVVNDIESELKLRDGDMLFISIGKKPLVQELLGKILIQFANILESKGKTVRSSGYKWLWVIDFPLFSKQEGDSGIKPTHHPFTQPHPEDLNFLDTDPLKVRGLHYDLVTNGWEIGGGSIRIHDSNLQKIILNTLDIDSKEMSYLIDALASGAPPHGGIALGLDRYIAMLCNANSIRDVIAFPKTIEGRDLMSGAPVGISEEEKKLYNIKTLDD